MTRNVIMCWAQEQTAYTSWATSKDGTRDMDLQPEATLPQGFLDLRLPMALWEEITSGTYLRTDSTSIRKFGATVF